MNCKNCNKRLVEGADFCYACGAKVVKERITAKKLRMNFFNDFLGWDNKYFKTLRTFLIHPENVINPYIEGTRKKFIAPFTFLAIGVGLVTFLFNSFSDEYAEISSRMVNDSFYETMFSSIERLDKEKPESYFSSDEYQKKYTEYREEQIQISQNYSRVTITYFNIMVLLTMPLYTYMAFLTFGRKRFNYGEHLVINSYIQGFSMISAMLFFGLSFLVSPSLYPLSILVTFFYYMLTYKKLYEISWTKSFLRLLKFLGILLATIIIVSIIAFIVGVLVALVGRFF
ncbi:DUF3667 domain-containing protein [Aquimarina sp. 2201CG5-10]|uniref:DUF3667 domain-containing protein n=1 Tax=Aquimarina callyspongiae TaxID=3098150 RepID=UPI002AB4A278|nr:DUF3667 domain-containing protein [Aquimarina sp. 2201CG5-10]MDY8135737.1 DUF3667 domain-containing protein [Aquimarina sp. 2201CG5-10]